MSEVYAVRASHGEYSDRDEWIVAVYADHEKARSHVLRATEWIRAENAIPRGQRDWTKPNPFDPRGFADEYWCSTVEMRDEVPVDAATRAR